MGKSKKVRLSDIAERLGLSTVSISKALREHPDISKKTKALVKKTAKEMGYVPNFLARSLSSKQSKTLGVVVPKIAHLFFSKALDGIHEVAAEQGYEIVLTLSRESAEAERKHIETLLSMRVDGILISVSQQTPDRDIYERAHEMNVPLVFFDRAAEHLAERFGLSSATVDDRGGARAAMDHMLDQGYRKIAHLAGYSHIEIGQERRLGYEEAFREHGLSFEQDWIVEGGFSERYGYHGFKKLLDQMDEAPEVVFAVTFPVALGALDAMQAVSPSLLEQVQLIAFGNQAFHRYLRQPFIFVHQPASDLGRRATTLLIEEINGSDRDEPQRIVLPTRLILPEEASQGLPYLEETTNAEEPVADK